MRTNPLLLLLLVVQAFALSTGQTPKPSPPPPSTRPQSSPSPQSVEQVGPNDVVRITTKLVQVDALITDRNGKPVTDLRPEEIRILEDGKPQTITHFSLITAGGAAKSPGSSAPAPSAKAIARDAPPLVPTNLRREQVQRTIAVVVDDLGLSFESIHYLRIALRKFVDEQMEPGDLVAITRASGGSGALQQFTSDKRILYAAIERVKWYPLGRAGADAVNRLEANPTAGALPADQEAAADAFLAAAEARRQEMIAGGTIGTVQYVIRGLAELPGRKSVMLMSDGIRMTKYEEMEALRRLADQANRASVVIYTMDARGLQPLTITAADNLGLRGSSKTIARQMDMQLGARRKDFFDLQNGLSFLADQTGGLFIHNRNDLAGGIQSIMNDQKAYYLIGYRPDESTFDPRTGGRKFHDLSLKVTRPGKFNVRMSKGFYGFTTSDAKVARGPATASQQVLDALTSPFGAAGVQVRLTSLFGDDPNRGSLLTSMLHVRATDLTFSEEPDGWHKADFDIVAVTVGNNGSVVDQLSQTQSIKVRGDTYQRMLKDGFVYFITVPIKKPGAYQLRAALRDHGSERVGSASQFVEVPDIKSDRLLLSGLLVSGIDPSSLKKPQSAAGSTGNGAAANEPKSQPAEDAGAMDPTAGPAVRQFQRGQYLQYGVSVYNAQLDKVSGRPQLLLNVRLYRDGQAVFEGEPLAVDAARAADLKRLPAAGAIQLGTALVPGEYVLQVIVTDQLADPKHRFAAQWIDFEIVK